MNADLIRLGENARRAAGALMVAAAPAKNAALEAIARTLEENAAEIFAANAEDIAAGKAAGIAPNLLDRMLLDEKRLAGIVEGVRQVAALKDPIGEVLHAETLPNGLIVSQMRVPLGVVGMIYEARPNVTVDAAVLCLKSGNAVILRGSKDILRSNVCLVKLMRQALTEAGLAPDCIALVEDPSRETATAFMKLSGYLDVLIPRGGAGLIRSTVENATVPVIETGTGNCHVYVDKDADLEKALPILMNAKTQRTSVCNACESLLIHRAVADASRPRSGEGSAGKGCGDPRRRNCPDLGQPHPARHRGGLLQGIPGAGTERQGGGQRRGGHRPHQQVQHQALGLHCQRELYHREEVPAGCGQRLRLCQRLYPVLGWIRVRAGR